MTLVQIDGRDVAERVFAKEAQEVDLSTLTLDELAERANGGHRSVLRALKTTLDIALQVGDLLWEIRARVGDEWKDWADAHIEFSKSTRSNYMRLSHYRDHIPAGEVEVHRAVRSLRGLPYLGDVGSGSFRHPPETVAYAQHLYSDKGWTKKAIARELDVSDSVVAAWVDPAYREKRAADLKRWQRRRREAARALKEKQEREERDRLARERGGNLGKAYDQVRKLQPVIDAAIAEGLTVEARALLVRVEDEIFKALKR